MEKTVNGVKCKIVESEWDVYFDMALAMLEEILANNAKNKKRLYINLGLIALVILLIAGVFTVDAIANQKGDLELTAEQAQAYIENMSIGSNSNIYFVTGDVSLDMIRCIGSMYFNKNLFTKTPISVGTSLPFSLPIFSLPIFSVILFFLSVKTL